MLRKLLILSLAVMSLGSANAFEIKHSKAESDSFSPFSGAVEQTNRWKTRADQGSLDFSIANEVYTAYKLNSTKVDDMVYMAFEMSSENATTFADDEITSVNITTGVYMVGQIYKNLVKDITIFITPDLQSEPVYTQAATLGDIGFEEYKIALDTPYKIEAGKSFYIGYSFKVPNANQYYIPVDGIPTNNAEGCWIGVLSNETVKWSNYATQMGSICMGCTITGNNFPQSVAALEDYAGPSYAAPGEEFQYLILFRNKGFTATNVEVEYSVAGGEAQTYTADVYSWTTGQLATIGYNEYGLLVIPMKSNVEGLALPLSFKLAKVDGVANGSQETSFSSIINCFARSKGFPRVNVIEEGTGTWCGWCPRGIVMMEYAAEKYPDFFARIGIHASSTVSDPMQVSSTLQVRRALFTGFPSAFVNRIERLSSMSTKEIDQYVEDNEDVPGAMNISELTATMLDNVNLKAETKVVSGLDLANDDRFRLAYYLTQNNVGPYNQTNYYSGGGEGVMGGWEQKSDPVSTLYDDVCRYLLGGLKGVSGSLPTAIKAGEEMTYNAEMTTAAVNASEFYLTAFVIDNQSGEILNAKQIKVEKEYSAVNEISADAIAVSKKYYSISGVEVKNPSNGIFIVRIVYSDGSVKTTKEAFK